MTPSTPYSRVDARQVGPAFARVPIMFLLANVPVLVLVLFLGVSLYVRQSSEKIFKGHWETGAAIIGGLVAGALGNLLLYRRIAGVTAHLTDTLNESSDQEAQLRAILDAAADGILTCDEDKHLLSLNDAACLMFGYEADELLGRPCELLLSRGATLDKVGTREQHILGLGGSVEGKRKDGSRFPLSLAISKVRLAGRAIFTLIVHDLTTLKKAQRDSEAASRAKSVFLANVSHEIRTPLNGILGMAQVLSANLVQPEQQRQVAMLTHSAESLVSLLEQVLDYARLETGALRLNSAVFSPRALLREVLGEWKAQVQLKGLRLSDQLVTEGPDSFVGDAARLRQVLGSLVSNAVKFTPAGGVVTVRIRRGAALHIEVEDTGIGIPPDKLGSIFTAFEQADGSATRQHSGVGLGLSLAAKLVALMGGKLEVESAVGRGSVFRVEVPPLSSDDSYHEMALPRPPLLLVSAEEGERQGLERLIRGWGWEVAGVCDGRAALPALVRGAVECSPFGLIVWQEDREGGDAIDWMQQVAECPAHCPVVLLRDGKKPGLAEWPAGVRVILPRKPSPRELHEVLARWDRTGPSLAAS